MKGKSNRFSSNLEAKLLHSGWYDGRRIDDDTIYRHCIPVIRNQGCRLFPAALNILREFGGLCIINVPLEKAPCDPHYVNVWPAPHVSTAKMWYHIEWQYGEVLFPIADYAGEMSLLVASSGKIYADGYGFWKCGNTFDEALERLKGDGPSIERINNSRDSERGQEGEKIYEVLMNYLEKLKA